MSTGTNPLEAMTPVQLKAACWEAARIEGEACFEYARQLRRHGRWGSQSHELMLAKANAEEATAVAEALDAEFARRRKLK